MYDRHCFNYEDLRTLTNGAFKKYLLRHYGTELSYFSACERGEGKGKRGYGENPHYHLMFFLTPTKKELYHSEKYIYDYYKIGPKKGQPKYKNHKVRTVYKPIPPKDFRNLIRKYWQGTELSWKETDPQAFKFGIVQEGENLGLVKDYRACTYVSKYVCKDATQIKKDKYFHSRIRKEISDKYSEAQLNEMFFKDKASEDDIKALLTELLPGVTLLDLQNTVADAEKQLMYDYYATNSIGYRDWCKSFIDEKADEKIK